MTTPLNPAFAVLILLAVIALRVLFVWRRRCSSVVPLPPGPKPLPIIGNMHQMPDDYQENEYLSWGRRFGELSYGFFASCY